MSSQKISQPHSAISLGAEHSISGRFDKVPEADHSHFDSAAAALVAHQHAISAAQDDESQLEASLIQSLYQRFSGLETGPSVSASQLGNSQPVSPLRETPSAHIASQSLQQHHQTFSPSSPASASSSGMMLNSSGLYGSMPASSSQLQQMQALQQQQSQQQASLRSQSPSPFGIGQYQSSPFSPNPAAGAAAPFGAALPSSSAARPSASASASPMMSASVPSQSQPTMPMTASVASQQKMSVNFLLQSLKNENDLLRAELTSLRQSNLDLRTELDRTKNSKDLDIARSRDATQEQAAGEITRLAGEMEGLRTELRRSEQARLQLEEIMKHAHGEDGAKNQRLVQLETSVAQSAGSMARLAQDIELFCRHILPTFNASMFGADSSSSASSLPNGARFSPDFGLDEMVKRLDKGVQMLKLVVDAKMETLTIIRNKLKEENLTLKSSLDKSLSRQNVGQSALAQTESDYKREKAEMLSELEQIKNMYEARLEESRIKLETVQQSSQEQASRFSEKDANVRQLLSEKEDAIRKAAHLEDRLQQDEASRAQLAADLSLQRKQNQTLQEELDSLKLSQKFLTRPGEPGSKLPAEKVDLMRMMNQLLSENNALKEERARMMTEIKGLKKGALQHQYSNSIGAKEVQMAASDQVTDTELTAKILRRQLSMSGAGSPSPSAPMSNSGLGGYSSYGSAPLGSVPLSSAAGLGSSIGLPMAAVSGSMNPMLSAAGGYGAGHGLNISMLSQSSYSPLPHSPSSFQQQQQQQQYYR